MKDQFWFVQVDKTVRMSHKVATARDACIACFGSVSWRMVAKPAGAVVSKVQSATYRKRLLEEDSGWYRPELLSLERIGCPPEYVAGLIVNKKNDWDGKKWITT